MTQNKSELSISPKTIVEGELGSAKPTIVEHKTETNEGQSLSFQQKVFRGWQLVEQFPARGGEADVFLVKKGNEERILKLFRYGLNPKIEIFEKMSQIAKKNPHFFPLIHEFGVDPETKRFFELEEFIKDGSLSELIKVNPLRESEIINILGTLSEALSILHSNGILHLDIKPENILLKCLVPVFPILTDFGIASMLDPEFSKKLTDVKGTSYYQSPESLSGVMGQKSDWWSLGIVILELILGKNPFDGLQRQVVFFHLTTQGVPIPDSLPKSWNPLVRGLLTRDPEKRWGYNEVKRWSKGEDVEFFFEAPPSQAANHEFKNAAEASQEKTNLSKKLLESSDSDIKPFLREISNSNNLTQKEAEEILPPLLSHQNSQDVQIRMLARACLGRINFLYPDLSIPHLLSSHQPKPNPSELFSDPKFQAALSAANGGGISSGASEASNSDLAINYDEKFCTECGQKIKSKAEICVNCGCRQTPKAENSNIHKRSGGVEKQSPSLLSYFFISSEDSQKWYNNISFRIAILFVIILFSMVLGANKRPAEVTPYSVSQDFVLGVLKQMNLTKAAPILPESASFARGPMSVTEIDQGKIQVVAYVDGINSLGVRLRQEYVCILSKSGEKDWKYEDLSFKVPNVLRVK